MEKAYNILISSIDSQTFSECSFSSPRSKEDGVKGIYVQKLKTSSDFKVETRLEKHNDIVTVSKEQLLTNVKASYLKNFKQCHLKTTKYNHQILINKKLKAKVITSDRENVENKTHNRKKNYLIPDGTVCPFLIEIGIMDSHGNVKTNYFKKFKQINRFLEFVDDLYQDIDKNEKNKEYHLVDFGCGKSYLTFALYHYFSFIKKVPVKITGIDLKQEVIDHCNQISKKLEYQNLHFAHGLIHEFKTDSHVDFVVTLHACDTATDEAILFSLKHQVDKMMFVPCCQHELNKQLQNNSSQVMLKHGIFRDRVTALVTDTIRAQLLDVCGYKVQSMEFIDLEHTAKNILLRCSKTNKTGQQRADSYNKFKDFRNQWGVAPYLESKLIEQGLLPKSENKDNEGI